MTVKELKKKLSTVPDHMEVFIKQENTEFSLSLVQEAKVIEAEFSEDSGPILAKDDVFLLSDEY
jgi:hypothetical protein